MSWGRKDHVWNVLGMGRKVVWQEQSRWGGKDRQVTGTDCSCGSLKTFVRTLLSFSLCLEAIAWFWTETWCELTQYFLKALSGDSSWSRNIFIVIEGIICPFHSHRLMSIQWNFLETMQHIILDRLKAKPGKCTHLYIYILLSETLKRFSKFKLFSLYCFVLEGKLFFIKLFYLC